MHGHAPHGNGPADPARITAEIERLARLHGDRISMGAALRDWTTFRIGGPALALCRMHNPDDARRFLENAREREIPAVVLGGGSNVLADDGGFHGLVLQMAMDVFAIEGDAVRVGAGLGFDALIAASLREGLTGLEFASGIPGSVGGALVGNAGCYGHEIGEFLAEATILRANGTVETVGPESFAFAYRHSAFKARDDLVLEAVFRLSRGDAAAAGDERQDHMEERRRKHPVDLPCAGSYFKNLPPETPGDRRRAAGALLEEAGAKEMREGDAAVFEGHANIIVNRGTAASRDVLALAERMKTAVHARFGVELTEEVRHLRPSGWHLGT